MPTIKIPGRPLGDYGTYEQMLEWVLNINRDGQEREFLGAWRAGDLSEWPEYIDWLKNQRVL